MPAPPNPPPPPPGAQGGAQGGAANLLGNVDVAEANPNVEIQRLTASQVAFKGHLTRSLKRLVSAINATKASQSPAAQLECNTLLSAAKTRLEVVMSTYEQLEALDPARSQEYQTKMDETSSRYDTIAASAYKAMAECERPAAPTNTAAPVPSAVPATCKVQSALKPDKLSRDATPEQKGIHGFANFGPSTQLRICRFYRFRISRRTSSPALLWSWPPRFTI